MLVSVRATRRRERRKRRGGIVHTTAWTDPARRCYSLQRNWSVIRRDLLLFMLIDRRVMINAASAGLCDCPKLRGPFDVRASAGLPAISLAAGQFYVYFSAAAATSRRRQNLVLIPRGGCASGSGMPLPPASRCCRTAPLAKASCGDSHWALV